MQEKYESNQAHKTILVTGAFGFLGRHLQNAFKPYQEQHKIIFLGRKDCDLQRYQQVENVLLSYSPNVVIHAAAVCGGIKANSKRPATFIKTNLEMGLNLFNAVQNINNRKDLFGINRVYTLGSVCAYPKYCPTPFKEDDLWNGYPEETNAPYGMAKRMLLMMGQAYRQQYGLGGAHLIPVNLYGEYDHFDLEDSHVIPALINKFTTAVTKGYKKVECWGTGNATREFLYAGDAAEAIVKAALTDLDTDLPINLGTGVDISIKELALLIGKLTDFQGEIEFTGEVSDGQPKRCLDVSRAKHLLKWEARTKLHDGLIKTISWYRSRQED
jgi:GDP-L-fucose synthase